MAKKQKKTKTFRENLRAARIAAGLSQTEAANACGARQTTWSRIENGHVWPSIENAERYAQAVGTTLKDLLP